ncbi:FHA domain-containing protein [Scytonema sp. NUACC26]|uniref:FHA domain-containing protein n=1 Tax=Scytonema sp. NUACC26 TaxID=3140176 RepID=UPI0034DBE694
MSKTCLNCGYERNAPNATECEVCDSPLSASPIQPNISSSQDSSQSHLLSQTPPPDPVVSYTDPPPTIDTERLETRVSYPDPPPTIDIEIPELQTLYPDPPPSIQISSAMNITCPQCNESNPPSTQFCNLCGYEFRSPSVESLQSSQQSKIEEISPTHPSYFEASNTEVQPPSQFPDSSYTHPQSSLSNSVAIANTARLTSKQAGSPISEIVLEDSNLVGRFDPDSGPVDIDLEGFVGAEYISRNHGEIYREGQQWKIKDLGSENGIFIKRSGQTRYGSRITTPETLNPGDEVAFGKIRFLFQSP